jgi:hypothetical protein
MAMAPPAQIKMSPAFAGSQLTVPPWNFLWFELRQRLAARLLGKAPGEVERLDD